MLNGLDLFSGIGGITIALSEWVKPVAYCENEPYAQALLLSRMREGVLPAAPIWDDVSSLNKSVWGAAVPDIIYGGFPCQDISVAGTGAGLAGQRSGLFFEVVRLCGDFRPQFIFLENVPAITVRGLDRVLMELASLGYDCRWTIVSAAEVGAPHLRERWFLFAHANGNGIRHESEPEPECSHSPEPFPNGQKGALAYASSLRGRKDERISGERGSQVADPYRGGKEMANGDGERLAIRKGKSRNSGEKFETVIRSSWWSTEPNVGRVANGIPARVDRLRGLGNAVVPLQAREAFIRLSGIGAMT